MAKQATGHVRWFNGVASTRVRIAPGKRESFVMPTCTTEQEAQKRSCVVAEVAQRLRTARIDVEQCRRVLSVVAASPAHTLAANLHAAQDLVGGTWRPIGSAPKVPTFKQIGDDWTSGKLATRYPDQIRVKRSAAADKSRLEKHVYEKLGPIAIDRVTLDDCERVMRELPAKLETATRRNIGQLITRIMAMAVYPLRLIAVSPIPSGFLPSSPKQKALATLYPDEDRRLLACVKVPFEYRLLWGFLTREGMRGGEASALTWADLDLERGAVRLDKNKTDDPRAWALNPSVAGVLRWYREQHRKADKPDDHVFRAPDGEPYQLHGRRGLANQLRAHLKLVGLDKERPELFTTTDERRRIRVHDLRGVFVTVALANGRSESWISDRTGHRSSQMIAKYKRVARTFGELQSGDLTPLADALPEMALDRERSLASFISDDKPSPDVSFPGNSMVPAAYETQERFQIPLPAQQNQPLSHSAVQSGTNDPVEAALADALTRAAAAQQWSTVEVLSRELAARREARASVVQLSAERARRKG